MAAKKDKQRYLKSCSRWYDYSRARDAMRPRGYTAPNLPLRYIPTPF